MLHVRTAGDHLQYIEGQVGRGSRLPVPAVPGEREAGGVLRKGTAKEGLVNENHN